MKISVFTVITAFLLGIALFGIFKALVLLKDNIDLNRAVGRLTLDLQSSETNLKQTRAALSDTYMKIASLDVDLGDAKSKLGIKEKELKGLFGYNKQLTQQLKKISAAYENVSEANKDMQDRALRTELENSEMRKKLSSVDELKKAIRDLKAKMRQERKKKSAAPPVKGKLKEKEKLVAPPLVSHPLISEGNMGYFVKDGKSTFEGTVAIKVVPVEATSF
jgi:chromosome segregation ATPase